MNPTSSLATRSARRPIENMLIACGLMLPLAVLTHPTLGQAASAPAPSAPTAPSSAPVAVPTTPSAWSLSSLRNRRQATANGQPQVALSPLTPASTSPQATQPAPAGTTAAPAAAARIVLPPPSTIPLPPTSPTPPTAPTPPTSTAGQPTPSSPPPSTPPADPDPAGGPLPPGTATPPLPPNPEPLPNSGLSGAGSHPFTSLPLDAAGFSTLNPAADSLVIHVSSSTGNDANDGLSPSRAKRTIAAGMSLMRSGFPDQVLLKRGDTFQSTTIWWRNSGRSQTERAVLGAYGEHPDRPLVLITSGNGLAFSGSHQFIAITGISLRPASLEPGADRQTGIYAYASLRHVLFEDLHISGFSGNLALMRDDRITSAELRGIALRRCIIVDAFPAASGHSVGLYTERYDGLLLEENLFDTNGYRPGVTTPTIFNHNVYANSNGANFIARGNVFARPSSHSLQARSGGFIEDNLVIAAPIGILAGGGDAPAPDGVTVRMAGNVILHGANIDVHSRGFAIDLKNIREGVVASNIIADKRVAGEAWAIGSGVSGGPAGVGLRNITIENNLIADWPGSLILPDQPASVWGTSVIRGNRISLGANAGSSRFVTANGAFVPSFQSNRYLGRTAAWAPFRLGGNNLNIAGWFTASGESGGTYSETPVPLTPTLETIAQQANAGSTTDALLAEMRLQRRGYWRTNITAAHINAAFRSGYGVTWAGPTPIPNP